MMVAIKYRIMVRAVTLVRQQIKKGEMEHGYTCELCASEDSIHGHHPDYTKPYFVIWLCAKCHKNHHADLLRLKYINPIYNDEFWEIQRIKAGQLLRGKHVLDSRPFSGNANYSLSN